MNTENNDEFMINSILEKAPQITILVVGDVMLDRFVYGDIKRMSPECDTAPVLDIYKETKMPGGAANVAANLESLGVKTHLIGIIGKDEPAKELSKLFKNDNGLIVSETRPTTCKSRYVYQDTHLIRADQEVTSELTESEIASLLNKINEQISECDVIILSDYNKGVLSEEVISAVIALAHKHETPILIDPKKSNYQIYKGASLITPNLKELSAFTELSVETNEQIKIAAQKFMDELALNKLIVTRSEQGMSIFSSTDEPVHIKHEDIKAIDVSGAGDTAIAALALGIGTGADLINAAKFANHAGGIVVRMSGTSQIQKEDFTNQDHKQINLTIQKNPRLPNICSWHEAKEQIDDWKKQNLSVGFTNGCFDILHYGHVTYLNDARDKCDRLVVGLNHDQSIKILKGANRPIHDEQSRASVLGALACVDMVVLFGAENQEDDNTPCALIEAIKPNLYVKGGDYTIDQLPEAAIMSKIGGRTEIMPLYDGHSTTSSIQKMKKQAS